MRCSTAREFSRSVEETRLIIEGDTGEYRNANRHIRSKRESSDPGDSDEGTRLPAACYMYTTRAATIGHKPGCKKIPMTTTDTIENCHHHTRFCPCRFSVLAYVNRRYHRLCLSLLFVSFFRSVHLLFLPYRCCCLSCLLFLLGQFLLFRRIPIWMGYWMRRPRPKRKAQFCPTANIHSCCIRKDKTVIDGWMRKHSAHNYIFMLKGYFIIKARKAKKRKPGLNSSSHAKSWILWLKINKYDYERTRMFGSSA